MHLGHPVVTNVPRWFFGFKLKVIELGFHNQIKKERKKARYES